MVVREEDPRFLPLVVLKKFMSDIFKPLRDKGLRTIIKKRLFLVVLVTEERGSELLASF